MMPPLRPHHFINKIILGDVSDLIKLIPDNSVDVVLTDPRMDLVKMGFTFFSTKFLPKLFENNSFKYFWQIVLYCPEGMVKSPIGTQSICHVLEKVIKVS